MVAAYIEHRPESENVEEPTNYYVIVVGDDEIGKFSTQRSARDRAVAEGYTPVHVARVRSMQDRRNPDHWRKDSGATFLAERKKIFARRLTEVYFWALIGLVPLLSFILDPGYLSHPKSYLMNAPFNVLASTLIYAFPFFSFQIFSVLPLEYLRSLANSRRENESLSSTSSRASKLGSLPVASASLEARRDDRLSFVTSGILDNSDANAALSRISDLNSNQLASLYAIEAAKSTRRIQGRAGSFIFAGIGIAILGIAFFEYDYSLTLVTQKSPVSVLDRLITLIPRAGILIFIEFIALFFLRQYRTTMDEYRYFEALARAKQEALVALKIMYERGDDSTAVDYISAARVFTKNITLSKDESTELLEARKLQKDEIILLEKIADALSIVQKLKQKE